MHSKRLPGWAQAACTAAAALVFLLVYEWAVYKVPVTQIFLPTSSWSDEVILQQAASRQLCGTAHRRILRLQRVPRRSGAPTRPGARRCSSSTRCRAAAARAECVPLVQPAVRRGRLDVFRLGRAAELETPGCVCALALAAMNAPIRYVFSAMQEPLHYALVLAVLGCGILARRDRNRAAWGVLCALCAVATLVRPYEAVLWLYPLALAWRDRRRAAVCVAGGAVSLGGTLVLMSKFYAPYFFTNVDMGALQEAAHGHLLEAAKDMARKLIGAMQTVFAAMASDFANRTGGYYLLLFALLAVVIVCLAVDARRGRPIFWKGCCRCHGGHRFSGADVDVSPRRGLAPHAGAGRAAAGKPAGGRCPPGGRHGAGCGRAGAAGCGEPGRRLHRCPITAPSGTPRSSRWKPC